MKYLLSLTILGITVFQPSPDIGESSGRVVDTRSGAAVAGATVRIGGRVANAATDSTGRFSFRTVRQGRVGVETRRVGYYAGAGRASLIGDGLDHIEIGLDPVLVCLDECRHSPTSTPGYVRVTRLPNTR